MDAYFFGASASTESGLNTYVNVICWNPPSQLLNAYNVDVKELKTYQQLAIYFIPIFTNLGFINIIVVAVRLYWFDKHLGILGLPALVFMMRTILIYFCSTFAPIEA